ncbi:MAG: hypothetical protein JNK72_09240 [Myxococcales bacterium]|nr:hypothetical protein [Myxococcales bacterium]
MKRADTPVEAPRWAPLPAVLGAAAALAMLAGVRAWVLRRPLAEAPLVQLHEGDYVAVIAPLFREQGCASGACHGAPGARPFLASALRDAQAVIDEGRAMRAYVVPGRAAESALAHRMRDRHRGSAEASACAQRALSRWIEGRSVTGCRP